ncbi:MAG: hypothetical protein RIQ72_679 [Candidatus Parcubacteria bacterium]
MFTWDHDFTYCIGILASDGNISKDGRHIKFISKDLYIIEICKKVLKPNCRITTQSRAQEKIKRYFVLQFSDVKLVRFLHTTGIHPAKSKTIESVSVPDIFFADFIRGLFDGDGSISLINHPESKHLQVKLRFYSASRLFLEWIHKKLIFHLGISGGSISFGARCYALSFGKADAGKIIKFMYYSNNLSCLDRKKQLCGQVVELVYT